MATEIGTLVANRYKLINPIGSGNMSTVYKAEDTRRSNRIVAVKILNTVHEDELKQELFRRETKALDKLEHPNIISISDYGWSEEQKCYYIILEYIPYTLIDEVKRHGSEDTSWSWPLLRSLTNALTHAHSQGVIHRDIKPTNILMSEAGDPILTDFGISRLKYELGTGVTVSSFWSIGYAAPEQRNSQQATEKSDIYSLGCVFYFILSKCAPQSNGPSPQDIQNLAAPAILKKMLRDMLETNSEQRPDTNVLLRRLEQLSARYTPLPKLFLLVTDNARKALYDMGYTNRSSFQEACEALSKELGGDIAEEAYLTLEQNQDLSVLTESFRLVCTRDSTYPILVIKAIHQLYEPKLESKKQDASKLRYSWQFIERDTMYTLPKDHLELKKTLDDLFDQLKTHHVVQQATKERRAERKNFTKAWDAVLRFQKNQIATDSKLEYISWRKEGNNLIFALRHPAPDKLSWLDSSPIAIINMEPKEQSIFIGHLISIEGKEVQVAWVPSTIQNKQYSGKLPATGRLGLFQREAQIAIERQHWALRALIDGATANTALADVLLDISRAEFENHDNSIEFFQHDLAEDKKKAVQQALAARDLFLLQGPPGTGKTTTLAEIILQILKNKPDAQILVSSQSNVAVNHILSHVARLREGQRTEIVRLGRTEKIKQGAEEWGLEQRLDSWRTEVIENTNTVIKELKSKIKQQQKEQKLARNLPSETIETLEQCQVLLEDLEGDFQELADYETQEAQLLEHLTFASRDETLSTVEIEKDLTSCKAQKQEKTRSIQEDLDLIRSYIPEELQPKVSKQPRKEKENITQTINRILTSEDPNSKESMLLNLVKGWQKIFGKQADFSQPILERANIFAATCLITGSRYLKNLTFDWAIIDEAGRATAPELLVPLVRSRRSIIVGDERQLPPMLDENLKQEELVQLQVPREELEESLFATMIKQGKEENLPAVQMLTVQHRMHPAIGQLISTVFYDGKLKHGIDESKRHHSLPWIDKPIVWYSTTRHPKHQEKSSANSFYNRVEVNHIYKTLLRLEKTYYEMEERREVAVITPYNAQISELKAQITPESAHWKAIKIEIATVDAFQGRDCDIVLYSTVRSNDEKKLGFLKDRRRLNVALSRARQLLIIVGDIWTLENGRAGSDGNPYQELIKYIRENHQDCSIEDIKMEDDHE